MQQNFFTQWNAPTDPGLYVVMLQYKDSKASQIVRNVGAMDGEVSIRVVQTNKAYF